MGNGTLRCTLTQEDLRRNGVGLDDFFSNTENAREFLEKLIRIAEEEVGYKANGNMMSIQAAVLPDNNIVLTFSENQVSSTEIIEQLKSMVSNKKETKEPKEDVKEGILKELGEKMQIQKIPQHEAEESENTGVEGDYDYIVTFELFPRVLEFCRILSPSEEAVSRLYYLEKEKSYYLHADLNCSSRKYVYEFVAASMEYATNIEKNSVRISYLEEHGKVICRERALMALAQL